MSFRLFRSRKRCGNVEQAAMEVYEKIKDHSKERPCKFVLDDIGYIFYAPGLLISFCVKPKYRDKENLIYFSNLIKKHVGPKFSCYLYSINTRGIGFLKKMGMKVVGSNKLVTLLII